MIHDQGARVSEVQDDRLRDKQPNLVVGRTQHAVLHVLKGDVYTE